ncbi:MAG: ABC transporter ATP-binding protein [Schumannella sp.]
MSATTQTDALVVEGLSGGYDRFDVVHDIAFRVGCGEAVALLGPNGAGKTTVLRAIMGLLRHRRGRIEIDGTDVVAAPPHRIARGLAAMVPEGRRLFVGQSVEDNLRLGGIRLRGDRARTEELLAGVFELFPVIERYRDREATALSGGEQQMVAVGRALMAEPRVLVLDEPSLGLSPVMVENLYRAIAGVRDRGIGLLLIEQMVGAALSVADDVTVLENGRVAASGGVESFRSSKELLNAYLGGGAGG